MNRRVMQAVLAASLLLLPLAAARAQDDLVDDAAPESKLKEDGLDWYYSPGLSLAFTDTRNVIGQPEGSSLTLAVKSDGGFAYRSGDHEYRNNLNINVAFSRTPVIDEFIKSADSFKYESIYLWYLLEWLGPYVRLSLQTQIFESFDVRQHNDTMFNITYLDGSTETRGGQRFRITDGWMPLTLRESVGAFAQPYKTEELNLEARAGFGGLHTFADDQFAVTGADNDARTVDLIELKDFHAGAVEVSFALHGALEEKKVLYKAGADFLIPVISDDDTDRDPLDLTNMEFYAEINFRLLKWLSLDYQFKAIKQPQVLDEFQIQNNLLLTIGWTFAPEKEEPKKAE